MHSLSVISYEIPAKLIIFWRNIEAEQTTKLILVGVTSSIVPFLLTNKKICLLSCLLMFMDGCFWIACFLSHFWTWKERKKMMLKTVKIMIEALKIRIKTKNKDKGRENNGKDSRNNDND